MTRLIVTTSKRNAPVHEVSGNFFIVDLDNKKILKKTVGIDPPYRHLDINPRGGMRGMRGVSALEDKLAVANYSTIFIFNTRWDLIKVITTRFCSGIHEILFAYGKLWVTSAVNDELHSFDDLDAPKDFFLTRFQLDTVGDKGDGYSSFSDQRQYGEHDFRSRRKYGNEKYDHLHVNSVCKAENGGLLVSFGLITSPHFSILMNIKTFLLNLDLWKYFLQVNQILRRLLAREKKMLTELVYQPSKWDSAIYKLDKNGKSSLLLTISDVVNPSHSVRALASGMGIYLDTSHGKLVEFDLVTGKLLQSTFITDKFLRGAVQLPNSQLLLGGGNELIIFDLTHRKIVDKIFLSDDPLETVHGIDILPNTFELPPSSLTEHLGKVLGFDGDKVIWQNSTDSHFS